MRRCLLILLLLAYSLAAYSQAYKYRFRIIDFPENFRNQFSKQVDEDAAGMLWFVTNNGLHRYDGNQVLTFDLQSTPALPDISIRLLFADSRHRLWIATRNALVRFDLQRWTMQIIPQQHGGVAELQEPFVTAIAEGQDGTIYTGLSNGQLYRILQDSLQLITQLHMPANDTLGGPLPISTIQEPSPGELWLTTAKGQIISIRHSGATFQQPTYYEPPQLANELINFFQLSKSGKCLVGVVAKGPFLFDKKAVTATPLPGPADFAPLQNKNVYITGFADGRVLFFFTGYDTGKPGLTVYNPEKNSFENLTSVYPEAFRSNLFRGIKYKNGRVFIPNNRGMATVSATNLAVDVFGASLENTNSIRTIFKQPGGSLMIGSYLQKFIQFDEGSSQSKNLSSSLVACLLPWNKDTLLAGMEGDNLCWYLPGTNRFVPIKPQHPKAADPATNSIVYSLARENDSTVWVGTYAGLYLINPHTGNIVTGSFTHQNKLLQQAVVNDILKVGNCRFFATSEGLFKYNMLTGHCSMPLIAPGSPYAKSSFICLRLVNNQIWSGTNGNGLLVLDTAGNLLRHITTANGLAGNIVFSNPLCKNYVLAGTSSGLSIINVQSGHISNYSSQYYLPSNEFNRSAWFVNGDTVYMGTINGFARIVMNRLLQHQQNNSNPGIAFSNFTINSGSSTRYDYTLPYRRNPNLTIPPEANSFSIGFGGLGEITNELKLYYRLNADGPWQDIGQRREVTFVNIAPDNYTMQIAARLPDGKWMENVLTMPIDVQPAYYQTGWFKIMILAAVAGFVWLGIKYRERNLRKEEQLRSRIAGDLHDEVGSALTRIYFQADLLSAKETPANGTPATPLQKIAASSQEALSSMSDMVWSIDAHYDNASDMIARMKDYLARLQDELDCRYAFEVIGSFEKKHLAQIARQNIFLIFKEAVNNAVKYGQGCKINVQVLLAERTFTLVVKNTTPQQAAVAITQGGHGLESMKLRADKIKGTLSVTNSGNEFCVQLQVRD